MKGSIIAVAVLALVLTLVFVSCDDTPPIDDGTDAISTETDNAGSETEAKTESETETEKETDTETEAESETEPVDTETPPEETAAHATLPESTRKNNLVWLCTAVVTELDGIIQEIVKYTYNEHGALTLIDVMDPFYLDYRCELVYNEYWEYWSEGGVAYSSRLCELTDIFAEEGEVFDWHFEDGKLVRSSFMNDGRLFTYYTYDADGRLISEIEYEYLSDTDISEKTEYKYDDNGNLVEKIYANNDIYVGGTWVFTYVYDEKGQLIKETEYREKEDRTINYEYTYYDDGKLQSVSTVYGNDGEVRTTTYEYDDHGNVILKKNADYSDEFSYEYNKNGLLTKVDQKIYSYDDRDFIYDEYGNLYKQRSYGDNATVTTYYYAPFVLDDVQLAKLRDTETVYKKYCDHLEYLVSTDYYVVTESQYE